MKKIALTQGQFAKVDDENFEKINKWKWQASWDRDSKSFYATGIDYSEKLRTPIKMHRFILGLKKGDGIICDHINHDTLDNRKKNLRTATISQSSFNKRMRKNSTTGYKGVYLDKTKVLKKYRAKIKVEGKQIHLGYFDTPEEAYEMYKKASKKYHGVFGSLK